MPESQNTEYKSSWRDEYLKWICGFANANGGKLLIGINDRGKVVGVNNPKKLLEDIPNKIVQHLGLAVEMNLLTEEAKSYIEIIVPQSSLPISYRGVFYSRSGSTKQELKGIALHEFLLKKMGKSWDGISEEGVAIDELNIIAVRKFVRKALNNNRITRDVNPEDILDTLQNLNLLNKNNQPKNAALLVFGKNPQKYFNTAYFKIGRFGDADHDLLFQDIISGNIFSMADKVLEILRSKYLISPIHYEGFQRVEELEYPEEALREAILNAIVHKDYTCAPIQLSVYKDKLILWNPGELPEGLTVEILKQKHPSRPRNKNIAELFFKAGYIEVWGRGISKMINSCIEAGLPEPIIEEYSRGVQITFLKKDKVTDRVTNKVTDKVTDNQKMIIELLTKNAYYTTSELAEQVGISQRKIKENLRKLKEYEIIKRIGPAKGGYWEIIK